MLQVPGGLFATEDGISKMPQLLVISWVLLKHLLLLSSPVLERDRDVYGWTMCSARVMRTVSMSAPEVHGDDLTVVADSMHPVLRVIMAFQVLYVQVRVYGAWNLFMT